MRNYVPEKLMLILKWTRNKWNGTSPVIHEGQFNMIPCPTQHHTFVIPIVYLSIIL